MVRGEKKKSEGETERSKNNLKQKEGNVEFLCHILFLILILLLYIVSLDGVDYFLIFFFLTIFLSSFAGDIPSAHISFGP